MDHFQEKMFRLKEFAEDAFVEKEEEEYYYGPGGLQLKPKQKFKLFPTRHGFGWSILRFLVSTLFYLCHLILVVIFISFYVSTIAFCITAVLDMAFEMVTPAASTSSKKSLLSACLFFLLCSVLIVACLMLSLFWEVLKVVLFKNAMPYSIARSVFLALVLIVSGAWIGIEKAQSNEVSLLEYVDFVSTVSWIFAFASCILGSILLLLLVFTHSAKNRKILALHIAIVLILVAFSVISPVAFGIVANQTSGGTIAFVFFLPFLTAILMIYTYFRGKKKDKKTFIFHQNIILLFFGFFIFTFILTLYLSTPTHCSSNCKNEARRNAESVDRTAFSSNRYQICSSRWTSLELNIAELAFLVNLTYNREATNGNATAIRQFADDFFKSRNFNWTVKHSTKTSPIFFHLQYKKVSVIGIKGPDTTTEFAEGAKLWNEAATLQALAVIVPFLNHIPTMLISEYVAKASFINRIFHSGSNSFFFQAMEDYVKDINKANDTSEVILIGHSLGGGIAKIIGARLKIPAVSFSSPGIAYGHVKFGFSLDDAAKYGVSVSPQKDKIPLVNEIVGLQQNINCDGKTFVECHLITRTYCELHNGCGLAKPGCQSVLDN